MTPPKILLLGGYGNFGRRIAERLTQSPLCVVIAGRDGHKARDLAADLRARNPQAIAEGAAIDGDRTLDLALRQQRPQVVINLCGPFQRKSYAVAQSCIDRGVHYLDLADGRDFVTGIIALDAAARAAGVWVISGASTVPALSCAVLDHFQPDFAAIEAVRMGISPGQKADRGLATTEAILTYVGQKLKPVPGSDKVVYGWQAPYREDFPILGKRWMAACDIPDLDLIPARYGAREVRFSAGMESSLLHLGIWACAWAVRLGMPLNLPRHARFLLRLSHWFDRFGTADGGMAISVAGRDHQNRPHRRQWYIVARDGDGPQIPCVPAIILARRLAMGRQPGAGATPCVGFITLDEYMAELQGFKMTTHLRDYLGDPGQAGP